MPRPNKPEQSKNPNGSGNGAADKHESVRSEDIARRAYEIYQSRGEAHGNDLDHWLEAERELKPGGTSVTGSIPPTGQPSASSSVKPKKSKKTPSTGV